MTTNGVPQATQEMENYLQTAVQEVMAEKGLDLAKAYKILGVCFNEPKDQHQAHIAAILEETE